MKKVCLKVLFLLCLLSSSAGAQEIGNINPFLQHPEWYINVPDWAFYTAFKVAILHHVTIENTSDIPYRDVRIRIRYYSTAPSKYGTMVGQQEAVLPVTVPPHSKNTYLKSGTVIGSGSSLFYAGNLEVLGAVSVLD
ncbi:MAG: hypothetical protein HY693_02715 [Deltaproteobacteria bacterium]|nr:hypothetical protein [Deltaproteobacteria bacterium]